MTKALASAVLLAALAAGCNGGGAHEAGPVPTAPGARTYGSTAQEPASTGGGPTVSTSTATSAVALCASDQAAVAVASQQGAAGTIGTVWRLRNTAAHPCRSYGYPGMDFHTASGWLDVRVHRGGYPNIEKPPATVVVPAGGSLYFVSYWGDVDTDEGPCREFDGVKVTLPDNYESAKVRSSGCVDRNLVYVGPVTTTPPS